MIRYTRILLQPLQSCQVVEVIDVFNYRPQTKFEARYFVCGSRDQHRGGGGAAYRGDYADPPIPPPELGKRAVRILLECFLVSTEDKIDDTVAILDS